MEVFTEAWCVACCERMNESEAYRQAAATWEGSAVLVMTADEARGVTQERAAWLDMHHGTCRGTRMATDADFDGAAYVFEADPATWRRLLAGDTDPVAAAMAGKLRLTRGNLFTLARYAQAAREMVAAAGQAGGTFPATPG
jgi:putative sterol carrier protein